MNDEYWCEERGCGFVDKGHRCEQWSHTIRIPGEAIECISRRVREECAVRGVDWYMTATAILPEQLRAAIMGGKNE